MIFIQTLIDQLWIFYLQTSQEAKESVEKNHFFDVPTFLTVSGQLHLEAMAGWAKLHVFGLICDILAFGSCAPLLPISYLQRAPERKWAAVPGWWCERSMYVGESWTFDSGLWTRFCCYVSGVDWEYWMHPYRNDKRFVINSCSILNVCLLFFTFTVSQKFFLTWAITLLSSFFLFIPNYICVYSLSVVFLPPASFQFSCFIAFTLNAMFSLATKVITVE